MGKIKVPGYKSKTKRLFFLLLKFSNLPDLTNPRRWAAFVMPTETLDHLHQPFIMAELQIPPSLGFLNRPTNQRKFTIFVKTKHNSKWTH